MRDAPTWLDTAWFVERGVALHPHERDLAAGFDESVEKAIATTSLPALLRYEDRNSMTHSIESRVPYLTAELAELAARLPLQYLIGSDGTTKRVLRDALAGYVPSEVLARRDKVAFAVPEREWLGGGIASVPDVSPGLMVGHSVAGHWRAINHALFCQRLPLTIASYRKTSIHV